MADNSNRDEQVKAELKLIEAAKNGSESAKAELISQYSGLIHKLVTVQQRRSSYNYDEYPDMFNEGAIAFLRAIELYDMSKGARFGTYAYQWVEQAVKRHVPKHSGHMKLPGEKYRMMAKILKLLSDGYTRDEVMEELDITKETLNSVLRAKVPMMTLDRESAEEMNSLIETIADDDSCVETQATNELLKEALHRWVNQLDPEEQTLLSLRYGLNGIPRTFDEIAVIMNDTPLNPKAGSKNLTKGRVISACEKAEQKLLRIAKREEGALNHLSSTSMFANTSQGSENNLSNDDYNNANFGSVKG